MPEPEPNDELRTAIVDLTRQMQDTARSNEAMVQTIEDNRRANLLLIDAIENLSGATEELTNQLRQQTEAGDG